MKHIPFEPALLAFPVEPTVGPPERNEACDPAILPWYAAPPKLDVEHGLGSSREAVSRPGPGVATDVHWRIEASCHVTPEPFLWFVALHSHKQQNELYVETTFHIIEPPPPRASFGTLPALLLLLPLLFHTPPTKTWPVASPPRRRADGRSDRHAVSPASRGPTEHHPLSTGAWGETWKP